ncbi:hypothetical protein B7494_g162 [Chlorociboria aeruginascens]|nr:hypothetical protein B7494_g162 [Chlorociboria aeruginascens]
MDLSLNPSWRKVVEQQPFSSLAFIPQSGTGKDKSSLTQIKKHVMKDIGKARRKNVRKKLIEIPLEIPETIEDFNSTSSVEDLQLDYGLSTHIPGDVALREAPTDNRSSFEKPPSPSTAMVSAVRGSPWQEGFNTQIERLWVGLFDDRYNNTPPFRHAWLPLGLMDAASFHQVLSNAALDLMGLRKNSKIPETIESITHHSLAVKMVAQRVSSLNKATIDGVIAAISGICCYSFKTWNLDNWYTHMKGVREIIRLRGGIDSLNSNPRLRHCVSWSDIPGACSLDIKPMFPLPTISLSALPPVPLYHGISQTSLPAAYISNTWRSNYPRLFEIMQIMKDIRSFTLYTTREVRQNNGQIYHDGEFGPDHILPLIHRLLSLASDIHDEYHSPLQAVRLACILYLHEIRRLFGILAVVPDLHTTKLKALLEDETLDWTRLNLLKAWCIAMGAMESRGPKRQWFIQRLHMSMEELDIGTEEELETKLEQVLWYKDVHTLMFRELYGRVELPRVENNLMLPLIHCNLIA